MKILKNLGFQKGHTFYKYKREKNIHNKEVLLCKRQGHTIRAVHV